MKLHLPPALMHAMEEFQKARPRLSFYERDKRERELLRQVNGILQAPIKFMNRKERRKKAALKRAKGN